MDSSVALIVIALLLMAFAAWLLRDRHSAKGPPKGAQTANDDAQVTWLAGAEVLPEVELVCLQGPLQGQRFSFRRAFLTIGRQPENDVQLEGSLVSRQHAVLIANSDGIILKDLESTNGTWISGQQVHEHHLAERVPFQIGPGVFMLVPTQQSSAPSSLNLSVASLAAKDVAPVLSPAPSLAPSSSTVIRSLALQDYEQLKVLGEGGSAVVYLCRARDTGTQVAIKVLLNSADPYFKQKFQYESRLMLRHPHIVQTLGFGEAGGISYIIMEYMPGGSLRDLMVQQRLNLRGAIRIIGQICQALDYAHGHGVFHRDLKPENILLTHDGTAKLADFGIARFTSMRTVTTEGMLVGTPDYMSYEQAKGDDIDGRSDQYSLAIVIFELLTGCRPFQGEALTVVSQHLSAKPPSPRTFNPNIPRNVEKVILRSLDKNKNKRFPTMLKMAETLGYEPEALAPSAATAAPIAPKRARLVNLQTKDVLSLDQAVTVLGRHNVLPENPLISRNHAQVRQQDGYYVLEDMGSINGTFVNGIIANGPTPLTPGCYLNLGPAQFQFLID
jgi:serine/threonine protein kinase